MISIDKIDRAILDALQKNARINNHDMAQVVGLSDAACLRRVRRLEEEGIIAGYTAMLDRRKLGYDLTVFAEIALSSEGAAMLAAFEREVQIIDEVLECHLMSGDNDYLLKLAVRDLSDYERLHRNVLAQLPHVAKIKSSFSLRSIATPAGRMGQPRVSR